MNINIEPKIFASKTHLKRYWPESSRKMVYENAVKHLVSKNMDPEQFSIVVIERFLNGSWMDQLFYVPKKSTLNQLYRKIVGNSIESHSFYSPKKTLVLNTKTFEKIYEQNPNEQNIIYLELMSMNAFGSM